MLDGVVDVRDHGQPFVGYTLCPAGEQPVIAPGCDDLQLDPVGGAWGARVQRDPPAGPAIGPRAWQVDLDPARDADPQLLVAFGVDAEQLCARLEQAAPLRRQVIWIEVEIAGEQRDAAAAWLVLEHPGLDIQFDPSVCKVTRRRRNKEHVLVPLQRRRQHRAGHCRSGETRDQGAQARVRGGCLCRGHWSEPPVWADRA